MIDLTIQKQGLAHNLEKARENNIIIPTFAQMCHPETIPAAIQEKLKTVGLWDVNPLNLFRITWKNEAKETGGLYQAVPNYIEFPSALTGVPCRIIAMLRIATKPALDGLDDAPTTAIPSGLNKRSIDSATSLFCTDFNAPGRAQSVFPKPPSRMPTTAMPVTTAFQNLPQFFENREPIIRATKPPIQSDSIS